MKMVNGNWRSWLVVLLVVGWGAASHAQGDTFSVELPEFIGEIEGYPDEPHALFDFGQTFLTISEVRIEMSGTFTPGLARSDGTSWPLGETMVLMPEILIHLPDPGPGFALTGLYPTVSPFVMDQAVELWGSGTWDFLMDGTAEAILTLGWEGGWGWVTEIEPTVQISAARLVIDGTVPEPGTIVLLGMGGVALARRKRRRMK